MKKSIAIAGFVLGAVLAISMLLDRYLILDRYLKIDKLEHELAEANALNQRLKDFNLNRELTINELMVVHVPDKSGNYFGRTRSFLVPVHGLKAYPIPDDCDELAGIRKAIAEYLKDVKKEN